MKQGICCAIESESRARDLIYSQSAIQVEAARTFEKPIKPGAAELVGFFGFGVEEVSGSDGHKQIVHKYVLYGYNVVKIED